MKLAWIAPLALISVMSTAAAEHSPELEPAIRLAKSYLWAALNSKEARSFPESTKKIAALYEAIDTVAIRIATAADSWCAKDRSPYGYFDRESAEVFICKKTIAGSREIVASTIIHELIHSLGYFYDLQNGAIQEKEVKTSYYECETTRLEYRIIQWGGGYPAKDGYFQACLLQDDLDDPTLKRNFEGNITRVIMDRDLPDDCHAVHYSSHDHWANLLQQNKDLNRIAAFVESQTDRPFPDARNRRTRFEPTALIQAVWSNRPNWVKYLLENGADINLIDKEGWTATMVAAHIGNTKILKQLLDKEPNLTLKNSDGLTALDLAVKRNQHEAAQMIQEAMQ